MKKAPLFIGIGLAVIISLTALVFVYNFINSGKESNSHRIAPETVSEYDNTAELIRDILFLIENLFSASEMREIISSNIFLLLNQNKIDELTLKFDTGTLTAEEKAYIKSFYEDIVRYGARFYPEASQILKHYIQGDGSDLEIYSKYFFESRLIRSIIEANPDHTLIGPVYIKVQDNPRIGYAVNGFYIRNIEGKIEIYQYIDFTNSVDDTDYISFEFRGIRARLPNRLIRVFEEDNGARGFTVYINEAP